MINDVVPKLRSLRTPVRKTLKKKGTLTIGMVETTPVVWKDELLRFEWVRNKKWGSVKMEYRDIGCFRFVSMADGTLRGAEFGHDHSFGTCYEENGVMYAFGVRGEARGDVLSNVVDILWSDDLVNWQQKEILRLPEDVHVFNNSVCKGADGYYIALEIHGREDWVGNGFTCIFAKSADLMNWELLDPLSHSYDHGRYTACPVLRYVDGYYYMICLEALPLKRYVPYITRTKDFETFEMGHYNPVMWYDDDDKLIQHPEWFTEEQLDYIANSVNCNVSDLDICDYNGKTVILYSWGNQLGKEFLAEAEYDGSMAEFLKSFYVDA